MIQRKNAQNIQGKREGGKKETKVLNFLRCCVPRGFKANDRTLVMSIEEFYK